MEAIFILFSNEVLRPDNGWRAGDKPVEENLSEYLTGWLLTVRHETLPIRHRPRKSRNLTDAL
jgi:hypothetical protein